MSRGTLNNNLVLKYTSKINISSYINRIRGTYIVPKRGIIKVSFVSGENNISTSYGIEHSGVEEAIVYGYLATGSLFVMNFPVNADEVLTVSRFSNIKDVVSAYFIPYG